MKTKLCILLAAAVMTTAAFTSNLDAQLLRRGCRNVQPVNCCQQRVVSVSRPIFTRNLARACCQNVSAQPANVVYQGVVPMQTMPMQSSCCGYPMVGGSYFDVLINDGQPGGNIVVDPIDQEDCDIAYANCLNNCQANCPGDSNCTQYCNCDKTVCQGGNSACTKPACLTVAAGPGLESNE